jgi:hemolysin D
MQSNPNNPQAGQQPYSPNQGQLSSSSAASGSELSPPVDGDPGALVPVTSPGGEIMPLQPALLQQSSIWSRAIMWAIIGVTTGVVTWAFLAKIEEAVPAIGQIETQGATQEVKVPVGGVVQQVFVRNGQKVNQGDRLLTLDPAAATAQQTSLKQVRSDLMQENAYYRLILQGTASSQQLMDGLSRLKPELASLARSRINLQAENQLFRAQLANPTAVALTPGQRERLASSQSELASRRAVAELEVSQLRQQLEQAKIQLAGAKDILKINEGILSDIKPLADEGALSRIQYLQQVQTVRNQQAEVARFAQETQRLTLAIAQAQQKLTNTVDVSTKDILTQIAANDQRIADIDSQFSKISIDNQRRIAEIDSQLIQAQQLVRYQELRAPITGVVFDLKANTAGYVASNTEPMLKIVPSQNYKAKVYIRNQDIGFVREGMMADVRLDSFPFSEFGDIKGKVTWVGDDALPPTPERQFVSFPAEIELQSQTMRVRGKDVPLQSGMSLSVNLKVRDRSVISLFLDSFNSNVEPFKNVR